MNWPLFSVLAGFLLPLSLVVRVTIGLARDAGPRWCPSRLFRLVELALLSIVLLGKAPGAIGVVSAEPGELGELAIAYVRSAWGVVQLLVIIGAVVVADLVKPRLLAQLTQEPLSEVMPARPAVLRDLGIVLICLGLAWAGAR